VADKRPTTGSQQPRNINAEFRAVEGDSNQIELSFSSEFAVDRWYGPEILLHDQGAVDFSRLLSVGTVLFSHGRDVNYGKMPIGRIDKAWLDTEQKKGRAVVNFDEDEDSQKVKSKVLSGSIKGVSFGYGVDSWEEVLPGKTSSNGRFTGPAYIGLRWEPFEISIEPTPADPSVGVGREIESHEADPASGRDNTINSGKEDNTNMARNKIPNFAPDNGAGEGGGQPNNEAAVREAATKGERQRVGEITALCREFDIDPQKYIDEGTTMDNVRAATLDVVKLRMKPVTTGGGDFRVEKDEADKFRAAASDSILMRAGKEPEKPADGARELRGMRLRDLAVECVTRKGVANAFRMDDDSLFREALSPDSQFSGIMNNTVNKSMATAYKAATTTYQVWTRKGSNPDFKPTTVYQISEAGDLANMTQGGEFKFDEMSDNGGVQRSLATFGRAWGFNRQALINDDMGMLVKVPEGYVRASARGINKLVYNQLGSNVAIYDKQALFNSNHKNLAITSDYINTDALSSGREAMRVQKNLRGKETLNIAPAFLIVPASLETESQKILWSTSDPTSNNAGVANVFRNSLSLVVEAELDSYSKTGWYLAAAPGDVDTVEVTYLNGNDMPKLESQVGFDFLGIKWRIFIDYGVTVLDYRGLYKNPGKIPA